MQTHNLDAVQDHAVRVTIELARRLEDVTGTLMAASVGICDDGAVDIKIMPEAEWGDDVHHTNDRVYGRSAPIS